MTRIKALQFALDAMCAFNQGNLSQDEMEAIDVVTNMLAKLQIQSRKQKQRKKGGNR